MRRKNEVLDVIRGRSGASLMFVLGIMTLLLSIGISVLTAAGAGAGAAANRRITSQLALYNDSMHKSIKYSLESSHGDKGRNVCSPYTSERPKTLGGQILGKAYIDYAPGSVGGFDIDLVPEIIGSGIDMSVYTSVAVTVEPRVLVTNYQAPRDEVWGVEGGEDGEDGGGSAYLISEAVARVPQSAVISGSVTVRITTSYGDRAVISVAEYEFWGAELTDDGVTDPFNGNMFIEDAGEWRFVSYEKLDQ